MARKISTNSSVKSLEDSVFYVPVFFLLFLCALVILFGGFLFSGQMLYGVDTIESGLYHRTFLVEYFKEYKAIPQWDPYQFGGTPYVDAFHGDIFYSPSFFKFFIPLYFHLGLILVLHFFLAGVFMYLASREFDLNKAASLFSAASYMFAPYLISLVASGHDGNIYVACLFPLVMLFLKRGLRTRPLLNFSLLGMVLGLILLSPHPRMSYFTLWAVALFTLYKIACDFFSKRSLSSILGKLLFVFYALVIAISFSAIQILPGYDYTSKYSMRTKVQFDYGWATSYSIHEEDIFAQLIPEFPGFTSIASEEGNYWGKNLIKYNTETIGIVPIFLALIGLFFSKRKHAYFFGGLALFALIYALGATTPLFKIFYYLIPKVHTLRAPAMIMFLFSFSISLLAGIGIQTIASFKESSRKRARKAFFYLVATLPLLMLLTAISFSLAGRKMLNLWISLFFERASDWQVAPGITKLDLAMLNLPSVQFGAWLGFIFTTLTALLIFAYINRKKTALLLSILVMITIADGVRYNKRFIRVVNHEDYLNADGVVNFFLDHKDYYRVFDLATTYPEVKLSQSGIEIVGGYQGNQFRSYSELLWNSQSTARSHSRFSNLVGARYLLVPTSVEIPKDFYGPIPLEIEMTSRDIKIARNDNAFERAYLVNSYEVVPQQIDICKRVLEGSEDLKQVALLEEPPMLEIPPIDLASDSAWIISKNIDSIVIGANCTANRLMVLTENFYDSWHAFIDGRSTKVLRAYGSFRAIALPAGSKSVLFKYKSERYELGKRITVLSSMYIILILGMSLLKELFKRGENQKAQVKVPDRQ